VHSLVPASLRYARRFWPSLKQERSAVRLRVGKEFLTALRQSRRWDLSQPSRFERERILNPHRMPRSSTRSGRTQGFLPEISEAPFAETWAGHDRKLTRCAADHSAVAALPGLYVATGSAATVSGSGPARGPVLADLVRGATPAVALDALR